ncbi:unnamed protein product [Dimorphilus gyrociliatus]|uniref:Uncharacterized protein n=1 Tax=Dimorphilus gyrociliatus TaxID=2664684 RepID=A0A7I8V8G1_9ANNE|nr:unnamed protein product [Dimorphilus gyrociliatus]
MNSELRNKIKFLNQDYLRTITSILCQNGLKEDFCIDYFMNGLHIFQHNSSSLRDAINFLSSYGFRDDLILKMLINFPELLEGKKENIIKTINILRLKFDFKDFMIPSVIVDTPELIDLKAEDLELRFSNLLKYFKKNHIRSLTRSCPQILFDDWESIVEKIDYILFEMNFDQKQIVQAELFRHSLMHIKFRHLLLIRSGVWQKPGKQSKGISDQPSLKKILCCSEYEFALLSGLSVREIKAFEQIVKVESDLRNKMAMDNEDIQDEEQENNV